MDKKYDYVSMVFVLILFVQLSSCQLIPQFSVTNPTMGAMTSYKLNYMAQNNLTTSTTFTANFNQSLLKVVDGINNCTIKLASINVLAPYCQCSNRVCTFKPMTASQPKAVQIEIHNVTNPLYMSQQNVAVFIYFTSSISYNYSTNISSNTYVPMPMTVNKLTQSDYGVGYTPVSYTFNISLSYISKNMQMQVMLPSQLTYASITSDLSFYSTIQNIQPTQFQNLIVFSLQVQANQNPSGFMLLTLSGLGNPRYLGNSSSFKITFFQTTAVSGCTTCKIAQLATGLAIESRNPGDVLALSITSSNYFISAVTTLSISLQLYAGIPQGGKVSIYLPPQIKPTDPIECGSIYGFIFPDNNPPSCTYNSAANRIDTVNFATPYFDSTGNGIISLKVINPLDSRQVNLKFQTYDTSGRMIGQSRSNSYYSATPLPLNITTTKSAQQVDKMFNLTGEITLSKSLNISSNYLQVTLPAVSYDLASIKCFSAGQDLNCTKTLDGMQQLIIKFAPPCVQCTAGNILKFVIVNLKNPSYINDANQVVVVNTRSVDGVIENSQKAIPLMPSPISLISYSKPTNQLVGTQYNLTMQLNIPDYVKINGGQIHIVFSAMSTYTDGQVLSGTYTGPTYSIQVVTNTSSTILSNSVQYYPDYSPDSISKIIFNICDGTISKCSLTDSSFTFVVRRLKIGYIPSQQITDILRISTKFGQIIAQKTMDTSSSAPIVATSALSIVASRSMTNTNSDFVFTFTSAQVVFDKVLTFTLPSALTINGQCSISSNQGTVSTFVCTKTSANSISISHQFDQDLMIIQTITYTISLTNVSTPTSMIPLNYVLQTTYNGTKNQKYTVRYAVQSAYPLSLTYSKSNYTINQQFRLSISIAPVTVFYDSWQVVLPKNTVIMQQDWVPSFALTQNTTHYILDRSGTMANNYTQIRGKNSLSTYEQPIYTINLLQSGYLVQQSVTNITNNQAVVLGCSVVVGNRTVSMYTNMTITCDRNSANGQLGQQSLIVRLPVNGYDYSMAKSYNNSAINTTLPTVVLPINMTSPRVVSTNVTGIRNLNYVPNLNASSNFVSNGISSIEITTVQNTTQKIVGRASIPANAYVTNDAYDIGNITSTRNIIKSGQYTNISIDYPTLLGTTQHIMHITLPFGQNTYINGISACYIGTPPQPCAIIDANTTDLRINMKPNSTVLLTKLLNSYPNTNYIRIRVYTSPEQQIVQQGYANVLPPIALERIQITGRAVSSKVADSNVISLQLKPTQLKIQTTHIIKIQVPTRMFTRTFNTDDCTVKPASSATTFTGCFYDYDESGWLKGIRLSSIGPFDIQINSTLTVNFSVTNAWTSYAFGNKSFVATVYRNQTTALSQGVCSLVDIYPGLTSFSLLTISQSQSTLSQSSLLAGVANNISMSIVLNGNIGNGTKILCMIPKDAFIFTTSANTKLQRQDISYYYISIATNCTLGGCQMYSQAVIFPVLNNYYVKKQRNNIILYTQYDGLPTSQSYSTVADYHIPSNMPMLTTTRTSPTGGDDTTVRIIFNLLSADIPTNTQIFNFGQVTVDICNNITNNKYNNTVYSYYQQSTSNTNNYQPVSTVTISKNSQNITVLIPSSYSNASTNSQIEIVGKNPLEVPIDSQKYWIVVQNTSHILYSNYNMMFTTKMVAVSQGLPLLRASAKVGDTTLLKIQGTLPYSDVVNYPLFTLTVNNISYGPISQHIIDMGLGSYTNPQTSDNQSPMSVQLCNISHCIYKQTSAAISPALQPIVLTSSDIAVSVPTSMNISSNYMLLINYSRPIVNKKFIRVYTDTKLYTSIGHVIGYYHNQTTQATQKISDLIFTTETVTDSSSNISRKLLTIRPKTVDKIPSLLSLQISYKTPQYQLSLQQSQVRVVYQLPTTTYSAFYDITISGKYLNASVSCTSNKTSDISNYTIAIQPLAKVGIVSVKLPAYISDVYNGDNPTLTSDDTMHRYLTIDVDGTSMPVTGVNTQLTGTGLVTNLYLLAYDPATMTYMVNIVVNGSQKSININIINATNPIDNRVLTFYIYQHEYETTPTLIYGYRQLSVKMTVLRPIHVYSGVRNATKIGTKIQLLLDILTQDSSTPDQMIIKLSSTQVLVQTTDAAGVSQPCTVCIDGIDCANNSITAVQYNNQNAILISQHQPGRHNYTLSGCLINSLFSQQPKTGDQIYVGLSMPYQTAQTTLNTSTYITPLVSTGEIQVLGMTSSSNKRADYTTLTLTIKPQNWRNIDGYLLQFDPLAYYLHNNMVCSINGQTVDKYVINSSTIFVQGLAESASQTMVIKINNIINYLQNNGFTLYTLKTKTTTTTNSTTNSTNNSTRTSAITSFNISNYGLTDQVYVPSAVVGYQAYSAETRIILPDNYVSSGVKKIVAINDYDIPAQLPVSTLKYSFGSVELGCAQSNIRYNKSISMECAVSTSGSATFTVQLFDTKLSSSPLTSYTKSIYIYPSPKDHCSNVLCDVCSTGPSGSQYCFSCRQGLYSSEGQCVSDCPAQTFPYNDKTCTQCSPDCQQCYDLYDNSCLACRDTSLVLDSGTCTEYCSVGYAYQAKYCINEQECSKAYGCRLCSPTGFCYQCLPDYEGEPTCKFAQLLPKNFFIFWMIPLLLLLPIVSVITCCKVGVSGYSHMLIYLLSVIQLFAWIFVIPKLPEQPLAMVMCAFLLLRIIISIISYQTYYNKLITHNKQQKLLGDHESEEKTDNLDAQSKKSKQKAKNQQNTNSQEQLPITHKERLARFSAHFLHCDAYELLMNKFGKPFMSITHNMPFFVVGILNRIIVMLFLIYVLAKAGSGDLLFVPLIGVLAGVGILLARVINSDKCQACVNKIRGV